MTPSGAMFSSPWIGYVAKLGLPSSLLTRAPTGPAGERRPYVPPPPPPCPFLVVDEAADGAGGEAADDGLAADLDLVAADAALKGDQLALDGGGGGGQGAFPAGGVAD